MRCFLRALTVFLLAALIGATPGYADEIVAQIKEALQHYENGELGEAVSFLNYAISQIQEKKTEVLKKTLPAPLPGWKAGEPSGEQAPLAFFGAGVTVSRHYYTESGEKTVDIEIISDSPLLQSMLAFITNPALLAAQPGLKLTRIKEHQAVQKFTSLAKEGEISIVIRSRMLVKVRGAGLEKIDEVLLYAKAIDYDALAKYVEK
jgi:hypothetical protein